MLVRSGSYVLFCVFVSGLLNAVSSAQEFRVIQTPPGATAPGGNTPQTVIRRSPKITYGFAKRPENDVYVELPTWAEMPLSNGLGQLSQSVFGLSLTIAAEHELSLQSHERFRAHTWPKEANATWAPYRTFVRYTKGEKPTLTFYVERQKSVTGTDPALQQPQPVQYLMEKVIPIAPDVVDDPQSPSNLIIPLLRLSEELSRKDIKEFLATEGYKGQPIKKSASTQIPAEITELLDQYHEIAQYAAIQKLLLLLKDQGESPEILAALSRACIQFASLTENLSWPIDRYYKARGLFYAQRLQAVYPEYSEAKWTMLYALGMSGFHSCALPLIEKYEKEPGEKPKWFVPLAAFCRFDYPQLLELTKEDDSDPFARYLMALTYLNGWGKQKLFMSSRFLRDHQDCLRIYDSFLQDAPLGVVVSMPFISNQYYAANRHKYLASIPTLAELEGLDPELLKAYKPTSRRGEENFASYNKLIAALREHPSYATRPDLQELSELLVQIDWWFAERLNLKSHSWGVNTDEILGAQPDLFAYHPQKNNYALYQDNRQKRKQIGDAFLKVEMQQTYLNRLVPKIAPDTDRQIHFRLTKMQEYNVDPNFSDSMQYAASFSRYFGGLDQFNTKTLVNSSPHCPTSIMYRIHYHPETVDIEKVSEQYAPNFNVSKKIGTKYYEEGDFEKATDYATKLIAMHPDQDTYELLSDSLYYYKDDDSYIQPLKDFLSDATSLGLEKVGPALRIASHYNERGEFDAAKPYIEMAAETYSGEGLYYMIAYQTKTGKLKEAAAWNLRCAQRYPTTVSGNILHAARMGNLKQVEQLTQYMATTGFAIDPANPDDLEGSNLTFCMMLDREEDLLKLAPAYFKAKRLEDAMSPVVYAIVRYKKDGEKNFDYAKQVHIELNRDLTFFNAIRHIMATTQPPSKEELAKLDNYILQHEHPTERPALRLQLGMALLANEHEDLAIPYLKNTAASPEMFQFFPSLAAHILLGMGKELDPVRVFDIDEETFHADRCLTNAEYLLAFNRYELAMERVDKVLKTHPDYHHALRCKAVTLRLKGDDLDAARKAYEEVLVHKPEAWSFHENLGFLCEQTGKSAEAIEHYKTILEHLPEFPTADNCNFRLAMLYSASSDKSLRNPSLAKQHVENLEAKKLQDPNNIMQQALIYAALNNREKFDAAILKINRTMTPQNRATTSPLLQQLVESFPYTRGDDWTTFESQFNKQ